MEFSFTNLLVLAFIVEVVTNFIKNYVPVIRKRGLTSLAAGIVGMLLCLLTSTGILETTGIVVPYVWLDYIITGIVLSRGAGLINDLSGRLAK